MYLCKTIHIKWIDSVRTGDSKSFAPPLSILFHIPPFLLQIRLPMLGQSGGDRGSIEAYLSTMAGE
jgi:hypothetical protein